MKKVLTHKEIASMGGKTIFQKRGKEWFSFLGKRSQQKRKEKLDLEKNPKIDTT